MAMRNSPGPQRFIEALTEYLGQVQEELLLSDDADATRMLQGEGRLLRTILRGYDAAEEMKRRIDKSEGSEGKGPSIATIT